MVITTTSTVSGKRKVFKIIKLEKLFFVSEDVSEVNNFIKTFQKILGEDFNWDEIGITVKVAYIFYVIFLLLATPFVIIIDLIFRNADIIFVSPTGMSIL